MAAYLTVNPPVRDQWYSRRNRPLTGCTVLHTSEGVLDTIGPDTGAEGLASFIRNRTTPGSYHDIADSDSWIHLVEYAHGAYHDGTGSNNWALSLSFACRTTDWARMPAGQRAGFLRQGARAFLAQQAYRKSIGAPLTELRLITKAQSDAGVSGFTYHGYRDPGRRTDPGVAAPNLFPIAEFITAIRAELGGANQEEYGMAFSQEDWTFFMYGPRFSGEQNYAQVIHQIRDTVVGQSATIGELTRSVVALAQNGGDIDEDALLSAITERVTKALQENTVKVDIDVSGAPST